MSNKKNFRKLTLTGLAASAAVVAVAPAVSAADAKSPFKDVNRTSVGSHYDAIIALSSEGIIKGQDGYFKPFENVSRSQVALMLQRALKYPVPADKAAELKQYKDVKASDNFADAVAAVSASGVFKGNNGQFNPWKDITREQMASVIVRAFNLKDLDKGKKADVYLGNVTSTHRDNVQILADLGITQELKNFRPVEPISRAAFSTMIYRAQQVAGGDKVAPVLELKGDSTVNVEYGGELKLPVVTATDNIDKDVEVKSVIRDDKGKELEKIDTKAPGTYTITYSAQDLAGNKAKDVVVKVVVGEDKLTVDAVTADNNKEVVVAFNKKVDAETAQNKDNYTFKANGSEAAVTISAAEVQKDGKTVVLTLANAAKNQDRYTVGVKNVKDAAGNTIAAVEKDLRFYDVTSPKVSDITVVGPRQVRIDFSEPLKTAPTVKLDNGSISTSVGSLSADGRSLTVTFAVEPSAGQHNLEVSGGTDFADFRVDSVAKAFNYANDTTAPSVSVEKADATNVTFKFSKPVKVNNANKLNVYHTVNGSDAYKASKFEAVAVNNGYSDTYKATFTTPIPEGAAKIYFAPEANALTDQWGNTVKAAELTTNVTLDRTAPSVTSVKSTSNKTVEVVFNKEVDATDAKNAANYVLRDSFGTQVKNNVSVSYADKKATLTFTDAVKPGSYTLAVQNIKDTTALQNKLDFQNVPLTVADTAAWDIEGNAVINGKTIRIKFSKPMSDTGLNDLRSYDVLDNKGNVISLPSGSRVVKTDAQTVEIQLGDAPSATPDSVNVVGSLTDTAGNRYPATVKNVKIESQSGPKLVAETAKVTSAKTVEFQVDQPLKGTLSPGQFTAEGYTFGQAGYVNDNGKATVTLTLSTGSQEFAPDAKPSISVAKEALEGTYGVKNAEAFPVAATDAVAPSVAKKNGSLNITSATIENGKGFTIEYDEALSTAPAANLLGGDLIITDGSKTLVNGTDYTTTLSNDGKTVTVALTGDNAKAGTFSVEGKNSPTYIKDVAGNKANGFSRTEVTVK